MKQPKIFIEITDAGVQGIEVQTSNAAGHESAHALLGKVSFELRQLDIALKSQSILAAA